MAPTTLILLSDGPLLERLTASLQIKGLHVTQCASVVDAERVLSTKSPSLVIVADILLDQGGVSWAGIWQQKLTNTQFVILCATQTDVKTQRTQLLGSGVRIVACEAEDAERLGESLATLIKKPANKSDHQSARSNEKSLQSELQTKLNTLRIEFASSIPQRMAALSTAIRDARQTPQALAPAVSLVHKLRGTCGTFGFHALSSAMENLEALLVSVTQDTHSELVKWEKIRQLFEQSQRLTEAKMMNPEDAL